MLKKLSEPTGNVENEKHDNDSENKIVRRAILIHAGPEGKPLQFLSANGPITFDAKRIERIVNVHNARLKQLAADYGGEDKIPLGAYEPLLDSHSQESNDNIIGRLTGPLKFEIRDVPKVGKNVPCAVADPGITFIGKDTVERVNDGRIYHLSIGISEKTDSLGELSTVVKPAAPGAMLLRQGTETTIHGGFNMSDQLKRMKAHTERLAKLSAMKDMVGESTKKLVATQETVKLSARKSEVSHRLSQFMRGGKMTPAEYKKLCAEDGLMKLASLNDDTLKIALMPYDAREAPVVRIGQVGSANSEEMGDIAKNLAKQKSKEEYTHLRSEVGKDFKHLSGKKLFEYDDEKKEDKKDMSGPKEESINPGKDPHAVPGQAGDEPQLAHLWGEMKKHLEAGNIEGVKDVHSKMAKHMTSDKHLAEYTGDVKSEDAKKATDDLQHQVDELNTQLARMAGMVEELIGAEKEEGEHFGEISHEHEQVAK